MPQKITNKNLQYTSTLPPFLARLRGEAAPANPDAPDPILAARRRPAKPRSGSAEAEDVPLVVDEDGNVLDGVQIGLDGTVRENDAPASQPQPSERDDEGGDDGKGEGQPPGDKDKGATVSVGSGGKNKKRKVGKVVGAERSSDDAAAGGVSSELGDQTDKKEKSKVGDDGAAKEGDNVKTKSGTKKKAKKIKLSFGDDEG